MSSTVFDREFEHAYPDGIEDGFWTLARNVAIADAVKRHHLDHLVDVGCGRGIVTDHLFRAGVDIVGVELGPARPLVRSAVPLYFETDARALPDDVRRRVRTLALFDVLEHVPEPAVFIDTLRESFPLVDALVCTVPARREVWTRYDTFYGHRVRFDRPTLTSLLAAARFDVVECGYLFHSLYLGLLATVLAGRERAVDIRAPGRATRPLHRLLARALVVENRLLPSALPGTSLLAVARARP